MVVLGIWLNFQKTWACENLSKLQESFLLNKEPFLLLLKREEFRKVQWINRKWNVMQNYVFTSFLWTFSYYLLYFADKLQKTNSFAWNCWFFEICQWNTTASMERFKQSRRNFALNFTFYSFTALSKILPYSKTVKTLRSCRYLDKTTLVVYLIFYKLIFFETLILFPESLITLITGAFALKK